jgi:drug/metabolite transporter (DMT)-like permease
MSSKPRTDILPILALLATAFFWGLLWYPMRWLEGHGVPGLWGTGILFASALTVGSPLLWRYRAQLTARPALLLGLMLANGWCNTAFILAVLDGEVVRVLLLFYLSPIWAVLLARLLLGERMPSQAWLTLVLAMGGALIILWQPSLGVPWPQGQADWLAISSGLGFAFSNVLVRMGQDLAIGLKVVISWLGVTVLTAVMLLSGAGGEIEWSVTPMVVAVLLGMVGIVMMSVCLMYGVTRMPVHRSAVILLFEVMVGAISAQWLAHEALGAREWLGGVLILGAAWLASRQQLHD